MSSSGLRRPKTAGAVGGFRQLGEVSDGALPAAGAPAAGGGRLPRRSGSQMSLHSGAGVDDSCWPQYVPIRRVPSAMKRNREIQTESNARPAAAPAIMGASNGQQVKELQQPLSGAALFYPYYVPGLQQNQLQQQPFVLLSPWQLPGYQNLPVLDPAQLRLLDSVVARRGSAPPGRQHPLDGAPTYRSGRNGSCWRHIRQCTGNLGNNIMFVDGHVKEDDCRRFPPHGYPGASNAGLSVYGRLAPKAQPRMAAGISLGNPVGNPARQNQQSLAMERAKTGTKYWYEDKKPAPLTPNTIQGRIMKTGSAY